MNKQEESAIPTVGAKAVGVDAGATLAKLALLLSDGAVHYETLPSRSLEAVAARVAHAGPQHLGMTGCGASTLADLLDGQLPNGSRHVTEFDAWGTGAHAQLEGLGSETLDPDAPYLLVSLGTGTSVMRVERGEVLRVGGTALGGGTVLGLGVALTGCESFEELCRWAEAGDRTKVDLLVSDIYREGEIQLSGDTTAAAFGNLSRWLSSDSDDDRPSREDLAVGVMSMVAENVGLVCAGLSAMTGIRTWVFGGSTLNHNPALQEILLRVGHNMGMQTHALPDGGHAGARGALELATRA